MQCHGKHFPAILYCCSCLVRVLVITIDGAYRRIFGRILGWHLRNSKDWASPYVYRIAKRNMADVKHLTKESDQSFMIAVSLIMTDNGNPFALAMRAIITCLQLYLYCLWCSTLVKTNAIAL